MKRRVEFARWHSDFASGGNRYDDELTAALMALGLDLREHAVTGPWPCPGPHDLQGFAEMLASGDDWLVDNIVGSAAPEAIAATVAAGRRVTLLMHYFPCDDPTVSAGERERLEASELKAVSVASNVVVTSAWAAREVSARYGRHDAVIAPPGVRPADVALGSVHSGAAPMVLWLARLNAQKDPLTFVEALAVLRDLDWTARLVGPDTVDTELTQEVHRRIASAGLADRVDVLGPQTGDALDSIWGGTDLLVHTSRSETYGMVVSEALSRGIPSVVATGTGAVEAQKVGGTFPRGDAAALAFELRWWLTSPQLQQTWRAEAIRLGPQLPTWADAAEIVASAVKR